jgi:hypothetical protein
LKTVLVSVGGRDAQRPTFEIVLGLDRAVIAHHHHDGAGRVGQGGDREHGRALGHEGERRAAAERNIDRIRRQGLQQPCIARKAADLDVEAAFLEEAGLGPDIGRNKRESLRLGLADANLRLCLGRRADQEGAEQSEGGDASRAARHFPLPRRSLLSSLLCGTPQRRQGVPDHFPAKMRCRQPIDDGVTRNVNSPNTRRTAPWVPASSCAHQAEPLRLDSMPGSREGLPATIKKDAHDQSAFDPGLRTLRPHPGPPRRDHPA